MQRFRQGFTVVELVVIAPIVVLTIGIFITLLVNMVGDVLATRTATKLTYDIQDALNIIEGDIKLSTAYLATNNVTLNPASKQGFDNATAAFENVGSNGQMLILSMLATTGNPISTTSAIVYLKNSPNDCLSSQITNNKPLTYNVIYFLKNNTLWRRTVMPADYLTSGCNTPWQQPSCQPGSTDSFCITEDVRLVDNIQANDFTVGYFSNPSSETNDPISENSGNTITQRQASLNGLSTAEVSITSKKIVSGRSVSQGGTIRATRLDTNASLLAKVTPDVVPATPVVRASINPNTPDAVDIAWDLVPGATTYGLNYTLDAAGANVYVNGVSNATTTGYTVTGGTRGKIVCAVVYAYSSAGNSNSSACITIPIWTTPLLANAWANYENTFAGAGFTKTSAGVVVLQGLIKRTAGAVVSGETLFTLPPDYRPAERMMYVTQTSSNTFSRIDIKTDGTVLCAACSAGWLSLNSIAFIPTSTNLLWTAAPFSNSWYNYSVYDSVTGWSVAAYTMDTIGRAHIKGLVRGGTTTNGAVIVTLPNPQYAVTKFQHMSVADDNHFGSLGISTTGTIVAKGAPTTNGYLSLNMMYYPGTTGSWTSPTFQNSWKAYDVTSYSVPGYTKGSDGIVSLRGLLNGGTIGAVITNLPSGYRPKNRLILSASSADAYARVDITATGDVIAASGTNSWVSLDGIYFVAEQ